MNAARDRTTQIDDKFTRSTADQKRAKHNKDEYIGGGDPSNGAKQAIVAVHTPKREGFKGQPGKTEDAGNHAAPQGDVTQRQHNQRRYNPTRYPSGKFDRAKD